MEYRKFVKGLKDAGWDNTNDTEEEVGLIEFWKGLFPVQAELEATEQERDFYQELYESLT